jgi:hypothetical protein
VDVGIAERRRCARLRASSCLPYRAVGIDLGRDGERVLARGRVRIVRPRRESVVVVIGELSSRSPESRPIERTCCVIESGSFARRAKRAACTFGLGFASAPMAAARRTRASLSSRKSRASALPSATFAKTPKARSFASFERAMPRTTSSAAEMRSPRWSARTT